MTMKFKIKIKKAEDRNRIKEGDDFLNKYVWNPKYPKYKFKVILSDNTSTNKEYPYKFDFSNHDKEIKVYHKEKRDDYNGHCGFVNCGFKDVYLFNQEFYIVKD